MDRETEKYYENLFEMFGTKGWKQFVEEINTSLKQIELGALYSTERDEDFKEIRGRALAFKLIVNYETVMRTTFDNEQRETPDADL